MTPVSGSRCCAPSSEASSSPKWQKGEQLPPAKSAHGSSLTYRPRAAKLPDGRHPVLVLQPFWSDRNQSEWGGTCDSNLGLSLPWDSKRQRKSSSYTSPLEEQPQKRKEHTGHRSKVLTLPQLFSTCVQSSEHLTRRKHQGFLRGEGRPWLNTTREKRMPKELNV